MEKVIKLPKNVGITFFDDILILGMTAEEHTTNIINLLQTLGKVNLKIKAKKSKMFQRSITFLGHEVSEDGITCFPDKIKVIKNLTAPTTPKQTKPFF